MPDTGFFEWILKAWPAGAALGGISLIAWFWVAKIMPQFFDLMQKRRDAISKVETDELSAKIKIAESQQATALSLAAASSELKQISVTQQQLANSLNGISENMKATVDMAQQMHDRCHAVSIK